MGGNTLAKLRQIAAELRVAGYRLPPGLGKAPKAVLVIAIETALAAGRPIAPPPVQIARRAPPPVAKNSVGGMRVQNIKNELKRMGRVPKGVSKLKKAELVEILREARRGGTPIPVNVAPQVGAKSPSQLRVQNLKNELKRLGRVPKGVSKLKKAELASLVREYRV